MKIIDKMLSLIGLQRKIRETDVQEMMRDNSCDHKWFWTGSVYDYDVLHYDRTTVYCPECDKEKIVSWKLKNSLIRAREIKQEHELNKQKDIDSLFQKLAQNKNK